MTTLNLAQSCWALQYSTLTRHSVEFSIMGLQLIFSWNKRTGRNLTSHTQIKAHRCEYHASVCLLENMGSREKQHFAINLELQSLIILFLRSKQTNRNFNCNVGWFWDRVKVKSYYSFRAECKQLKLTSWTTQQDPAFVAAHRTWVRGCQPCCRSGWTSEVTNVAQADVYVCVLWEGTLKADIKIIYRAIHKNERLTRDVLD